MPVTLLVQNEEVDASGDTRFTYTATVQMDEPPLSFVVTVDGGPDWDTRLIEAIQTEATKARAVGAISV